MVEFNESTIGLILVVAGIMMLLAEATSPGFFIAIPATIVLVLGVIGVVAPDFFFTWVSPVAAVVVAVPMTIVTILLYQKLAPPEAPTTTVGTSLIGKHGIVSKDVKPREISGKVVIDHQNWSATARKEIPAGTEIIVVESKGVHVTVETLSNKPSTEKVALLNRREK